jgi:hypothetical protein
VPCPVPGVSLANLGGGLPGRRFLSPLPAWPHSLRQLTEAARSIGRGQPREQSRWVVSGKDPLQRARARNSGAG